MVLTSFLITKISLNLTKKSFSTWTPLTIKRNCFRCYLHLNDWEGRWFAGWVFPVVSGRVNSLFHNGKNWNWKRYIKCYNSSSTRRVRVLAILSATTGKDLQSNWNTWKPKWKSEISLKVINKPIIGTKEKIFMLNEKSTRIRYEFI